ncbi:MAG: hypothetical protein K2J35_05315, partial [Eubacterium sp.]|nr:hypothetical protein [Eubacterium sp.]
MIVRCVWEHNGDDTLLYAQDYCGAFARGETKETALSKMPAEIISYLKWCNKPVSEIIVPEIVQEFSSNLIIADADTDVIFDTEKLLLTADKYLELKALVLKSAEDFQKLYDSIPNKNKSTLPIRKTFYGDVPRTAYEMYEHTKNVNDYYFGEIGIAADNNGTIYECRRRGFEQLERTDDYLNNAVLNGSYNEQWSLSKMLRRFLWHDRIHAKAMYRMAIKTFGENFVEN